MFSKGDYIVYGTSGVCRIEEITDAPFGKSEETTYYILKPLAAPSGSFVYIPVNNNKVNMRSLMTADQIESLREVVPSIDIITVDNEKTRREAYSAALNSNDPINWIKIIRTVGERRSAFFRARKRLPDIDLEYESLAQKCLFYEISIVFGYHYSAVADKIYEMLCGMFPQIQRT